MTTPMRLSMFLLSVSAFSSPASAQQPADFVFTNGSIYTVNEDQPWVDAVAVDGNEIVYVGDSDGAADFVGDDTRTVDLQDRLVLPGFVESHIHIAMGAGTTSGVILTMEDSVEDVLRKVKAYAEENPDKETIFGASYNAFLFDARGPNKALLDEIVPDRPVYLMDHTLHAVWVNSRALEAAGITSDTEDPPGGEYIRDENGEPTGAIKGGPAHMRVLEATKAITGESMKAAMPTVLEGLSAFGFTSAIDMGIPFASEPAFQAMVDLDQEGDLPLRLSVTYYVNTPGQVETAIDRLEHYADTYRSRNVWFDTLKITSDSVIENQKAAMLQPYLTTGDRGALYFDHSQMRTMVLGAAERGYNVTVHCIGDWAVRETLDAAAALRKAGYDDTLFSTTHTQMVHPDDRSRFAELNVTVQTTGNWAMQQPSYLDHLGQGRYDTLQFPFRYWADSGVNIALGADWPATPGGFEHGVNPFNNIYTAMHRRPPEGIIAELGSTSQPLPPLDQVLTLEEAIHGYTLGGAKMLGIEDEVGSIEVGKKADMIMLSQNLFEIDADEIPHTEVLATMFDGRVVHDIVDN